MLFCSFPRNVYRRCEKQRFYLNKVTLTPLATPPARGFYHFSMRYLIYLLAVIFLSCSKEAIEPENYILHVQNRYFEAVTVSVGEHFSEKLSPNTVSKAFTLPKGTYKVVAITASRLHLESTVQIQGSKSELTIDICPKGKISIVY